MHLLARRPSWHLSISGTLGVATKIPTVDFGAGFKHESGEHLFSVQKSSNLTLSFTRNVEGTHFNNKFCSHLVVRLWGLGPSDFFLRCFKFHAQSQLPKACLWGFGIAKKIPLWWVPSRHRIHPFLMCWVTQRNCAYLWLVQEEINTLKGVSKWLYRFDLCLWSNLVILAISLLSRMSGLVHLHNIN